MLAENKKYVDYIVEQAKNLINIDSPSGYCKEVLLSIKRGKDYVSRKQKVCGLHR